ncbi:MAG: redoxin domain-containing protein, partial [Bacteroidota bacterium]
MALTASNHFELGTLAPDFKLVNTVNHRRVSLAELKGTKGTAIFFICNHCPFVIHINPELVRVANAYQGKGIGFIAISSNDITTYPQDGPLFM